MAEKRSSALTILLRDGRKTLTKIELFDARAWASGSAGYRIRRSGAWVCEHGKYTYYTVAALGLYLRRQIVHCLGGAEITDPKEPAVRPGAYVRIRHYDAACCAHHMITAKVLGPPIRAIDGKWYVPVRTPDGTTYAEVHPCDTRIA